MDARRWFAVFLILALVLTGCQRARGTQPAAVPTAAPQAQQPAAGGTAGGRVLIEDDFQDGQADGWENNGGWTVQQSGDAYVYAIDGGGATWVPQGNSWENYAVRAATRLDSGSLAISYRLSRDGRYTLQYRTDGLELLREAPQGNLTTLASSGAPAAGGWHWFAILGYGAHLQVYVDGALWMDVHDPSPLLRGTIGFGTPQGSRALVDNVRAAQLGADPAGGAVSAPPASAAAPVLQPQADNMPLAQVPAPAEAPVQPQGGQQQQAAVEVSFSVEGAASADIRAGECVTTAWSVHNALEVYYQGGAVPLQGANDECPAQSATYVLEVVALDGSASEHTVRVNVGGGGGGLPDLQISGVNVPQAVAGQPMQIIVQVRNAGSSDAGASTVVWISHQGIIACSWDINLPAGETVDLSCQFPGYPQAGNVEWEVRVDTENEVAESNEGNNLRGNGITVQAPPNAEPPPAPFNCVAAPVSPTEVRISWMMEAVQIDGFHIYQGVTSLESTAGAGELVVTLGNLAPNTGYHFDVRAFRGGMESDADACAVDVVTLQ